MDILKGINAFGNQLTFTNTLTVTTSQSVSVNTDCRILIDGANTTLTLNYANNEDGVKVEIYAFAACTVKYYTNSTTPSQQAMLANTSLQLVYHNGWKRNGAYDAVWN